ncbi:MAG: methanogenesis marker 5 protein [Candidatus Helarchaeota archaeon]
MKKIFIFPPNSLILADLVDRFGHEPLMLQSQIRQRITNPDIDSPPFNITEEDLKKGLDFVPVEAPSGIRGRMGIIGPLIKEAEAAIIIEDADWSFGCLGCTRAANLVKYLISTKNIPLIRLNYPRDEEEAKSMVFKIKEFLENQN